MLSAENLREYCHTCLVKLEMKNDNISKSILINKFPELQHLIQLCVAKSTGDDSLGRYAPFLCCSCFTQWSDFSKLCKVAIKTHQVIKKILEKETLELENIGEKYVNIRTGENISEYSINNEMLDDKDEIENFEKESAFCTRNPNNSSKATDTNCTSDLKNKTEVQIKNSIKSKSIMKFRVSKKSSTTRKSLHKVSENALLLKDEENINLETNATKKVRYQCKKCDKYFWEKNKYDGHMKQVHEGITRPYKCQVCGRSYNLHKTLLQHKRESHNEKTQEPFKCVECNKMFKTGIILKQHMVNTHSEQKEAMRSICDKCGFIAAHQYSLSRHIINKHTETDHIQCSQCPKVFKTQYSLKHHVMGNHNQSNVKPFKCTECQLGFSRKTLLNQHKRTHLKYIERIKCDFEGCEVRFVKHGDKTHHMRLVHLKVKRHICDFCGKAFGAMQTLHHHRFIHTGEKPYKCNICGQAFRQRTAMNTHRKTHLKKN